MRRSFGTSDAYSHNLNALGHEAVEVVPNCPQLQLAWARERGSHRVARMVGSLLRGRGASLLNRVHLQSVLEEQIQSYDPNVVYFQDLYFPTDALLERLRRQQRLIVGQIASPAPPGKRLSAFDLLISSFPHFVSRFRSWGIDSEYLPLAFDERIPARLESSADPSSDRPHAVVFVGGIDPRVHRAGTRLLERVAGVADLQVWGYGADQLPSGSPLANHFRGEAWGLEMYLILAHARIVLNRHIDVAQGYANNMRLFEATGMGALLLTEAAPNLDRLFRPGSEVVAYKDDTDLIDAVGHYLETDEELEVIAAAGQRRTLEDHTYRRRIGELAAILQARVSRRP